MGHQQHWGTDQTQYGSREELTSDTFCPVSRFEVIVKRWWGSMVKTCRLVGSRQVAGKEMLLVLLKRHPNTKPALAPWLVHRRMSSSSSSLSGRVHWREGSVGGYSAVSLIFALGDVGDRLEVGVISTNLVSSQ